MTALALALFLAASAPSEEVMLVGDVSEVSACTRMGEVRSSSMMGGLLTGAGYKRALADLKKKAGKLGGTHVYLLNANSNYAGSNMMGIAYRCPAATPAA
jgi:hypothetical protein